MRRKAFSSTALAAACGLVLMTPGISLAAAPGFAQVASFLVCTNTDCGGETSGDDTETSSEIIDASADGMTLVYSDSPGETVGLIDISTPSAPGAIGAIDIGAEPTSVAVMMGKDSEDNDVEYILVGVNTSPSFSPTFNGDHDGELRVYDLADCVTNNGSCSAVATLDLGGQPDSVAVSPDETFAAIAIENERDEEACHTNDGVLVPGPDNSYYGEDNEDNCTDAGLEFGRLPQPSPGWLAVIANANTTAPSTWTVQNVPLTGLGGVLYPTDPEPEYVSINANNIALISLQENNALVQVDLSMPKVVDSDNAGSADLRAIDTEEEGLIQLKDDQPARLREPDGLTWIGTNHFATANEGDMDGGSRGFTIYESDGSTVVYEAGEDTSEPYDYLQVRHGHYPEERSRNKGSEPEAVAYAPSFAGKELLFVASERGSTVAVYDLTDKPAPVLVQFLPAVMGPESIAILADQNLIAIANEVDDEARSMVNLYHWQDLPDGPAYPTVVSVVDPSPPSAESFAPAPRPISFGALSGLTASNFPGMLYGVHDSFYKEPRIFEIDNTNKPAVITGYTQLSGLPQDELDALDLEGIARRPDGGFWLVSEGSGTIGDPDRPFVDENLLIRVNDAGVVQEQVTLPGGVAKRQVRFGFEGVAVSGSGADETVVVAFQREWTDDGKGVVRLGRYTPADGEWKFYWYPLDPREAIAGWVGLSEIVHVEDSRYWVLERDNQGGPFAAIKRIYEVDLDAKKFVFKDGNEGKTNGNGKKNGKGRAFPALIKTLVADILPVYQAENGWVPDKPEGMAIESNGNVVVVTDNDGVDDATGQTWLHNLGNLD